MNLWQCDFYETDWEVRKAADQFRSSFPLICLETDMAAWTAAAMAASYRKHPANNDFKCKGSDNRNRVPHLPSVISDNSS